MLLLCVLWVCWCIMHSLFINTSVAAYLKQVIPGIKRYYRFLYNGFSLATLIPLVFITRMEGGDIVFQWHGYGHIVRLIMILSALYLFRGGAKIYDFKTFLGIRQYSTGKDQLLLSQTPVFSRAGVFGITRHPWYLGSLIAIWSLPSAYPKPIFLCACILSLYLIVGTILEEQKIIAQYGEEYRKYSKQVSMFFPLKWMYRFFQSS